MPSLAQRGGEQGENGLALARPSCPLRGAAQAPLGQRHPCSECHWSAPLDTRALVWSSARGLASGGPQLGGAKRGDTALPNGVSWHKFQKGRGRN